MKLRDADGDTWESDGEGGWDFFTEDDHAYMPTLDLLERVWGPLIEVEDE